MDFRLLDLIATVVGCCEGARTPGLGHWPAAIARVAATLRRLLGEGAPWYRLRATATEASGSTLRRYLARLAVTGLPARVHAQLVRMLRGHRT